MRYEAASFVMSINVDKNTSLHDTPCQVPNYILMAFMPLFLLCVQKTANRIYIRVYLKVLLYSRRIGY